MIKPVRLQRSRQKKQVSPNGLPIIYCGRGSKYGNVFKIGDKVDINEWGDILSVKDHVKYIEYQKILDREDCLYLFKKYMSFVMAEYKESNKRSNVSCWCRLDQNCHCDLLLQIWND